MEMMMQAKQLKNDLMNERVYSTEAGGKVVAAYRKAHDALKKYVEQKGAGKE